VFKDICRSCKSASYAYFVSHDQMKNSKYLFHIGAYLFIKTYYYVVGHWLILLVFIYAFTANLLSKNLTNVSKNVSRRYYTIIIVL